MISTVHSHHYHRIFEKNVAICLTEVKGNIYMETYLICSLVFFFIVPSVVLFILYGRIAFELKKRTDLFVSNESRMHRKNKQMNLLKSTRTKSSTNKQNSLAESANFVSIDIPTSAIKETNKSRFKESKSEDHKSAPNMNNKQTIILLFSMTITFVITMLPFRAFSTWSIFATTEQIMKMGSVKFYSILFYCRMIFYLNSAVNPM
jgi:hypothetical protein